MAKKKKFPKLRSLWMLWNCETDDWVVAIDDPPEHEAYLCATSKKAILALQKHQKDGYDVESIPVRVL